MATQIPLSVTTALRWSSQGAESVPGRIGKIKFENDSAQIKTIWKFISPGATHSSGVRERLVQSFKHIMIALLNNRSSAGGVPSTRRCLVEQSLSARPLTAVSDNLEGLTTLSPNHLLLRRENAGAPFMPFSKRYHNLRKSFITAQAYVDMIWKKCTPEDHPQWNQRSKWSKGEVRMSGVFVSFSPLLAISRDNRS